MTKIHPNIDDALREACMDVMTLGTVSSPRGKLIRELIGQRIAFDMRYPLVTNPAREIGYKFYAAEAYWILTGRNDLAFFRDLKMPFIWEFSDDGFFYSGAYGPQIVDQLTYVCDMLSSDPDTRQAVIEVWRPNPRPSRDIPCTLSFQFLARGNKLHCVQSMRSSDVWLGYPYDAFNAAMLTMYIILLLRARKKNPRKGLDVGTHTLVVGSQHLYETNWTNAHKVIADKTANWYEPLSVGDFGNVEEFLSYLYGCAKHPDGVSPKNWNSSQPLET